MTKKNYKIILYYSMTYYNLHKYYVQCGLWSCFYFVDLVQLRTPMAVVKSPWNQNQSQWKTAIYSSFPKLHISEKDNTKRGRVRGAQKTSCLAVL